MLVFLSGMSDIQRIFEAAKEYANETKRWIILQLHSSLSIEEQDKVVFFDLIVHSSFIIANHLLRFRSLTLHPKVSVNAFSRRI